MRWPELAFKRGAEALGSIGIEERAGLNRIPVFGRANRGNREDIEPDLSDAGSDQGDGDGGGVRKIDDPVFDEGTAIDDSHVDGLIVGEVDDSHPGSERKSAMRGSHSLHIVDLAIGGGAAVIRMTVPTSESGFAIADFRGRRAWRSGVDSGVMLLSARGER